MPAIHVRFDLVEHGPPDRHFPRSMRCHYTVAGDRIPNLGHRELPMTVSRQRRQIRRLCFQSFADGAISPAVQTMARGTIGAVKFRTLPPPDQWTQLFCCSLVILALRLACFDTLLATPAPISANPAIATANTIPFDLITHLLAASHPFNLRRLAAFSVSNGAQFPSVGSKAPKPSTRGKGNLGGS